MIVNDNIEFVRIGGAAEKIARSSHTAYWFASRSTDGVLEMQEEEILSGFKTIADLLGYRVEKIDQPVAVQEAAE